MVDRRQFLKASVLGASASMLAWGGKLAAGPLNRSGKLVAGPAPRTPATTTVRVVSAWDFGVAANRAAWTILGKGGHALDAVEFGVQVPGSDLKNRRVGKGGYPDCDGHVTLDVSIMDGDGNCGAVAALAGSGCHRETRPRIPWQRSPQGNGFHRGRRQGFDCISRIPLALDRGDPQHNHR